jgi:hypothetical protein
MVDLSPSPTTEPRRPSYEKSDVEPRKIVFLGAVLLVAVAIALITGSVLLRSFFASYVRSQPQRSPLAFSPQPTPEPLLSVNPGEELRALRVQEDSLLKGLDWVDQEKGIVRIPIDTAIEILAQKGLPARTESAAADNSPASGKISAKNPARNEPTSSPAPPQRGRSKGEGESSESGGKTGKH